MKTDNELIAEFMGGESYTGNSLANTPIEVWSLPSDVSRVYSEIELQYHTSWDWLMPVVEKIESLEVKFKIDGVRILVVSKQLQYYWNGGMVSEPKIICVYHGCVQFIKWYNSQKA